MKYKLIIEGRLPDLNDYIRASNRNRHIGNRTKQDTENIISMYIMQQLRKVQIEKPVIINYIWYEPNRKRDLDNISSFGRKCIQDALVNMGILHNDGWKQILGFSDRFVIDKNNPRIELEIIEMGDDING